MDELIKILIIWSSDQCMAELMSVLGNATFNAYTKSFKYIEQALGEVSDKDFDIVLINWAEDSGALLSSLSKLRSANNKTPCICIIDNDADASVFETILKHDCSYVYRSCLNDLIFSIKRETTHYYERKKLEDSLTDSVTKYKRLTENTANGFAYCRVIYNSRGEPVDYVIMEANAAFERIIGVNRLEVLGRKVSEVFKDNLDFVMNFMRKYGEMTISGHSICEDNNFSKITNKWYKVFAFNCVKGYFAVIINDITGIKNAEEQMKKAKEEAERANRFKSDFLASMSHEIRSPLNGLMGMLELLLMTELEGQQREYLMIAKRSSDSLLNIVNNVLDMSKIEAGEMKLENTSFDIYTLLENAYKAHYTLASAKGIELMLEISEDIEPAVTGDPNKLMQVINNIVGNAVKFTDTGYVRLKVEQQLKQGSSMVLLFIVEDTGMGISEGDKGRLFRSFTQLGAPELRKAGGTGLGLSISNKLVELMGGRICVESTEGKGTRFSFSVKLEKSNQISFSSIKPERRKVLEDKNGYSILLVEDDKVNQTVIRLILEKLGHRVDVADGGVKAIQLYKQKNYDMILMDIQMADMDGIQVTHMIRELENNTGRHIPIIACTAHAFDNEKERFLKEGMDGFIAKPIVIGDLVKVIEVGLAAKRDILY